MCNLYGINNFKNNKNCMNCKSIERDFIAYLSSYSGFSVKNYDLILPISQVLKLSKNQVMVNEKESCGKNSLIDNSISGYRFIFSVTAVIFLFSSYIAVKCFPNDVSLQLPFLSRLRVAFRKKKSGLTKYLLIVFITLYFI